jgi:hypothetical protein
LFLQFCEYNLKKYLKMNLFESDILGASLNGSDYQRIWPTGLVFDATRFDATRPGDITQHPYQMSNTSTW